MEKKADTEAENAEKTESETDSSIMVNADGSRMLVVTMKLGSMETTMSIEISKPTEFPNSTGNIVEEDTAQLE